MFEVFGKTTLSPTFGALEGFNVIFVSVGQGSKFVKSHVDVGANLALNLHGFFGPDEVGLAVERVDEADAFFGDVGEALFVSGIGDVAPLFHGDDFAEAGAEGHDLEAARIGQGGAKPRVVAETIRSKAQRRFFSGRVVSACRRRADALVLLVSPDSLGKYRWAFDAWPCGFLWLPAGEPSSIGYIGGLAAEVVAIGKHGLSADGAQIGAREKTDIAVGADGHKSGGLDLAVGGFDDAGATETIREGFLDLKFHEIIIS